MNADLLICAGAVVVIVVGCVLKVVYRPRPKFRTFSLNEILLNPPAGIKTLVRSVDSVRVTNGKVTRLLHFALMYSRADFRLADQREKYLAVLSEDEK